MTQAQKQDKQRIETAKELLDMLNKEIAECEAKAAEWSGASKTGWVICDKTYCWTGEGTGLNGSGLNFRSSRAVIFVTRQEAYNNTDYYLVNGKGQPIYLTQRRAAEYFKAVAEEKRDHIRMINELLEKQSITI